MNRTTHFRQPLRSVTLTSPKRAASSSSNQPSKLAPCSMYNRLNTNVVATNALNVGRPRNLTTDNQCTRARKTMLYHQCINSMFNQQQLCKQREQAQRSSSKPKDSRYPTMSSLVKTPMEADGSSATNVSPEESALVTVLPPRRPTKRSSGSNSFFGPPGSTRRSLSPIGASSAAVAYDTDQPPAHPEDPVLGQRPRVNGIRHAQRILVI